ncbi:metallophosphoesterase family protein [Larkinella rosea]|uniref:Metallophosphoesterase n=1 Tax=Larkinella rosea TaxID=2025312 RepID=A0A3P1BUZ6_9BACT|nr:metallophosphoesterase family protein [Larkinella rosea]RRB04693.1 metallophosphoesterase [Larkinella rosea]
MKIALFSDIHANLPALEAVLADIDRQKPDAVYCLGDLVGYNSWPNEVIAEIRRRNIPTIAGNYDYGIGRSSDDCGCAYQTDDEKANGKVSIAYTNKTVGDEERAFLRTLPTQIRVNYELGNDPTHLWQQQTLVSLLLVHGSPRRVNEYLFEDRGDRSLARVLEGASADIMCFGHTHKPYYKVVNAQSEGETPYYRHAINIGSVGKPKDGDPRAGYVLLTIDEAVRPGSVDGIRVEFVRVPYDVERAALAVEQSELPDVYAQALRVAK